MKDSNDAQTIDWVDEVEVVSKEVATIWDSTSPKTLRSTKR
jgi:hypothetical protein